MTQESPDMLLHHPTVQNTVFFMSWGSCTTCLHRVALTCGLCKAAEGVFRVALLTMLRLPPAEGGGRGLGLPGQVYGHNLGLQVGHEVQLSQQTPRDPIVICVLNNKPCIWDEEKQSVWLCRAERGQFILCSGAANSHPVLRPSDKHPILQAAPPFVDKVLLQRWHGHQQPHAILTVFTKLEGSNLLCPQEN